jgi:CRISPR system Cascade subunit CasD
MRCLLLVLEGPLLSFGAEAVDSRGVVSDFPAASMLTGLLANALGYRRTDREKLARLHLRLQFVARIEREGNRISDFQTAKLGKDDVGWTTSGAPEGRDGGAATYQSPHIRRRDYDADKQVTVALTLADADDSPGLDDLATALRNPSRPLFLGRKPCLPERRIFEAIVNAADLLAALPPNQGATRMLLPDGSALPHDERRKVSDHRNWLSGVHGGQRNVLIRDLSDRAP